MSLTCVRSGCAMFCFLCAVGGCFTFQCTFFWIPEVKLDVDYVVDARIPWKQERPVVSDLSDVVVFFADRRCCSYNESQSWPATLVHCWC